MAESAPEDEARLILVAEHDEEPGVVCSGLGYQPVDPLVAESRSSRDLQVDGHARPASPMFCVRRHLFSMVGLALVAGMAMLILAVFGVARVRVSIAGLSQELESGASGHGFVIGQDVEAKSVEGGTWLKAKISTANSDGTYKILWRSGKTQDTVKTGQDLRKAFSLGQFVYMSRGASWSRGQVTNVNGDGTYVVHKVDDSAVMVSNSTSAITKMVAQVGSEGTEAAADLTLAFEVGQAVEATRGGVTGNRGKVVGDNRNATFQVEWQDGAKVELTKGGDFLRRILEVGQEVEGTRGGIPATRGVVVDYAGHGNYTVDWKDGMAIEQSQPGLSLHPLFAIGQPVEARRWEQDETLGSWRDARIVANNGGTMWTIAWGDGSHFDTLKRGTDLRKLYVVGDRVDGVHDGVPHKRATVVRNNGDGTYDLRWHDAVSSGDQESRHSSHLTKAHNVGDTVRGARGGQLDFDAKIAEDRHDGTYLVEWHDGNPHDRIKKGDELLSVKAVAEKPWQDQQLRAQSTSARSTSAPKSNAAPASSTTAAPSTTTAAPTSTTLHLRTLQSSGRMVRAESDLVFVKWLVKVGDKVHVGSKLCLVRESSGGSSGRLLSQGETNLLSPCNGTVVALLGVSPGDKIRKGEDVVSIEEPSTLPWYIIVILLCVIFVCLLILMCIFLRGRGGWRESVRHPDSRQVRESPRPPAAAAGAAGASTGARQAEAKAEAPPPAAAPPAAPDSRGQALGPAAGVAEQPPPRGDPVAYAAPPAPAGVPCEFLYPDGQTRVTKYLDHHPLGIQLARRHHNCHIEHFHFNSYAEHLGVPLKSSIVRLGDEDIPVDIEQHVCAKKVLAQIKHFPVWPLKVVFELPDGTEKSILFTEHPLGVELTRQAPITIHKVFKGSHAEAMGVQKGWVITMIKDLDCHRGSRANETLQHMSVKEVEAKLHDGLMHLDKAHYHKNEHHC